MRTRVKICGITREEDAQAAVRYGSDAIGLVFYPSSPRYVAAAPAARIAAALPPFVSSVGLFVDATPGEVEAILAQVHLDILQFHGSETAEECRRYGMPYMKAVRVRHDTNLLQYAAQYHDARALLLDAYLPGMAGGTGIVFDWGLIPEQFPLPIVLAGGLNPDNVADAIRQVHPYAVDVSGGVEQAKGIKDAAKVAAFMQGVQNAAL
ncbi:phosphoribosylanthranilate isomerase [Methylobacillus rhizosphaerae]|uniref:N-(5'-phosphoribosyl)anthranilate isomerase n=1 Tax=Methylobacillus rhizosphaerae TaxID=551994 RepID=A0A238YH54_9PROT|nr:phosphoribosylanthranilate isomerase [Methylobacillus rhizosphaerae]SNR70525.1 phosphoribosylanthranilate isomerase [Methylobacillus rhizosphaerae]